MVVSRGPYRLVARFLEIGGREMMRLENRLSRKLRLDMAGCVVEEGGAGGWLYR